MMHTILTWVYSTLAGVAGLTVAVLFFSSLGVFIDWLSSSETMRKIGMGLAVLFIIATVLLLGTSSSMIAHKLMYGTP